MRFVYLWKFKCLDKQFTNSLGNKCFDYNDAYHQSWVSLWGLMAVTWKHTACLALSLPLDKFVQKRNVWAWSSSWHRRHLVLQNNLYKFNSQCCHQIDINQQTLTILKKNNHIIIICFVKVKLFPFKLKKKVQIILDKGEKQQTIIKAKWNLNENNKNPL